MYVRMYVCVYVSSMYCYNLSHSDQLHVNPSEHPILFSEASYVTRQEREAAVQHLFESTSTPAIFSVKSAVLAAFASAKATAIVVDCGGGGTTVTAVHDGYCLTQSIMRSPLGGDMMTSCMGRALEKENVKVRPIYEFKKKLATADQGHGATVGDTEFQVIDLDFPKTTESYRRYCVSNIVRDCKESILRVSEVAYDEGLNANVPTMSYELPDGHVVEIGPERFRIPESMYDPSLLSKYDVGEGKIDVPSLKGLHSMVIESISKCDPDVRKDLFASVLLSGGNSVLPNMKERLEKELIAVGPQNSKIKVLAQQAQLERRFSSWIGGSILASLGSFQQMWLSKAEYEEHGAAHIHRKSP